VFLTWTPPPPPLVVGRRDPPVLLSLLLSAARPALAHVGKITLLIFTEERQSAVPGRARVGNEGRAPRQVRRAGPAGRFV
jgi:hypothetical protein